MWLVSMCWMAWNKVSHMHNRFTWKENLDHRSARLVRDQYCLSCGPIYILWTNYCENKIKKSDLSTQFIFVMVGIVVTFHMFIFIHNFWKFLLAQLVKSRSLKYRIRSCMHKNEIH